ncbi:LytTR family transcriptional regulator [Rudanella paleaurantiibacter]|uniref:LytTR family transcriptional regulator n=1 Tax=Rudanella paleaurantiibacter TaxID=2614655 RepID=A0A7J5TY16_9BACT|nr:LytTR family DNA-binding domain-containing protein [Rudanella paleaurantiibacter]KAB7728618.1 LytTR family transcriptional regulator [Rudanella paleaurantiibacter]
MPTSYIPQTQALQLPFFNCRQWVSCSDIVRFEGVGNYTRCYFRDGSKILVARSLKVLSGRLPDGAFVRVHRKHLLNVQFIRSLSVAFCQVIMSNGEQIPVARRRVAECRAYWASLN